MIFTSVVTRRGFSHPDWNEDNFYFQQTEKAIIGGVFDGCSTGKDSYFASKLFANVFRQTIDETKDVITIDCFSSLVNSYFRNNYKAAKTLQLDVAELLSTAILFAYSIDDCDLFVKFFGDGALYTNHRNNGYKTFKSDEDNQPDYIAYSLPAILTEDKFMDYWHLKKEFRGHSTDFSISTDGIFSFKKMDKEKPEKDVEAFLVQDDFLYNNPASLRRKLNMLKNCGYEHEDDVTIIRVVNK
jgi:hypothetical protein